MHGKQLYSGISASRGLRPLMVNTKQSFIFRFFGSIAMYQVWKSLTNY